MMSLLLKSAAMFALLVSAVGYSPAFALSVPSPYSASFEDVPQLICTDAKGGIDLGSGVRISDTVIITAAHVNSGSKCAAYEKPLANTRFEPKADVSFVTADLPDGFRAIVSCDGIHEGQHYRALGYADGGAPDVEPLVGTSMVVRGQSVMVGHVYHGMSGGAVIDSSGALVAIINALNSDGLAFAYVTPLTETYLCRAKA